MSRPLKTTIVLGVFVILLVWVATTAKHSSSPAGPTASPAAFAVTGPSTACRAWSGIDPVVMQAVAAGDRNALYQLETDGGPQREYQSLMRWAELAFARAENVVLASDLTIVQTRISSIASGSEPLSDLPVPATAVVDQCEPGTPPTTTQPGSGVGTPTGSVEPDSPGGPGTPIEPVSPLQQDSPLQPVTPAGTTAPTIDT